MKKILLLLTLTGITLGIQAQQNYCDHEGTKVMYYGWCSGVIDSMHVNPAPDAVNGSAFCTKYIRDTALYDNIHIYPNSRLVDVAPYDVTGSSAPKIRMKLYSSAPVGTDIKLQLGSKMDNSYPSGVHSEFSAVTTVQNAWQLVTFNFNGLIPGGMVASTDVDKLVLLFHTNSTARDTIYIDDVTGPELMPAGIAKEELPSAKLFQNTPNPAKELSRINFQLTNAGPVSLKIYDIVGNTVFTLVNDQMKAGTYSIPVETAGMPNGVYFYTLEAGRTKRSMKMIVSN
jgi:hypothetical protein